MMKKFLTISFILLISKVFAQPQKVVADKIIAQIFSGKN